jgi:hypothetical protein
MTQQQQVHFEERTEKAAASLRCAPRLLPYQPQEPGLSRDAEVRAGSVRRVVEQRPRLHAEGTGERFKRRGVYALHATTGQQAGRDGLGQASERGELVGVLQPAPLHMAVEVPTDHAVTVAFPLPLDK